MTIVKNIKNVLQKISLCCIFQLAFQTLSSFLFWNGGFRKAFAFDLLAF